MQQRSSRVDVVCYRLIFNLGLALGASYGTFKISKAVINVATNAMLMIEQVKTICKVRTALGFPYVALMAGSYICPDSFLRVYFVSDAVTKALQMIVIFLIGCVFVFQVPWKRLITLKRTPKEPEATFIENTVVDAEASGLIENIAVDVV